MYYCQLFFKLGGEEEIALHDINSETKKVFTSEGKLGVGLSAVVFFAAPPHNMKWPDQTSTMLTGRQTPQQITFPSTSLLAFWLKWQI